MQRAVRLEQGRRGHRLLAHPQRRGVAQQCGRRRRRGGTGAASRLGRKAQALERVSIRRAHAAVATPRSGLPAAGAAGRSSCRRHCCRRRRRSPLHRRSRRRSSAVCFERMRALSPQVAHGAQGGAGGGAAGVDAAELALFERDLAARREVRDLTEYHPLRLVWVCMWYVWRVHVVCRSCLRGVRAAGSYLLRVSYRDLLFSLSRSPWHRCPISAIPRIFIER